MIAPMPGPLKARCASCGAPYLGPTKPFAHRPGCAQAGRSSTEATMTMTTTGVTPRPVATGSDAEVALASRLTDAGLHGWEPQFYWALSERTETGKPRQYRADFAYPKAMLLVECEGQVHSIKAQRAVDCLRASTAAALGYRMIRVTKDMIVDGSAVALIARALSHNAPAGEGGKK